MKIAETDAFPVQLVQVRGFQDRIAVDRQIAIALIIRENNDDVRAAFLRGVKSGAETGEDEGERRDESDV